MSLYLRLQGSDWICWKVSYVGIVYRQYCFLNSRKIMFYSFFGCFIQHFPLLEWLISLHVLVILPSSWFLNSPTPPFSRILSCTSTQSYACSLSLSFILWDHFISFIICIISILFYATSSSFKPVSSVRHSFFHFISVYFISISNFHCRSSPSFLI